MKYNTLNLVIILAFSIFDASAEIREDNQKINAWKVESVSEYEGIYSIKENDSTFYGRAIITSYAEKGNIQLSICFIDVKDIAKKPVYHYLNGLYVDENGNIFREKKLIGSFQKIKPDGNPIEKYIPTLNINSKIYIR